MAKSKTTKSSTFWSWTFWLCAVSFYFYQFILRVSPSVMVKDLMSHFAIDATAVGVLAAFYYKAYTALQIPTGILVDRIGPRRLITGYGVLCVIGAACFAWAPSIGFAYIGRLLMGAGSVAGLIGAARVIRDYFPENRVGLLMSLTMTIGTIGGLAGGMPTALLIESAGWQQALWWLVALGGIVVVFVGLSLRDVPRYQHEKKAPERTSITEGLRLALRTPQVMISGICAMGLYLPLSVFADLWGPSFIMAAYDVTRPTAASMVSLVYIGLCIGSIGFALWAEKIRNRRIPIIIGMVGTCFFLTLLLWGNAQSMWLAGSFLFAMGLCTGAEMLCFTNAVHYMPVQHGGVTVAMVNMITMLAGAILQPVVGYALDILRKGRIHEGLPFYILEDYQLALSLVLACAVAVLAVSFRIRDR